MKTRISKIARLPLNIREQLNHRLQNGEMGAPLLKWLNAQPEVAAILAELFDHRPINKQNLSDWRHGGYEDWLRHQARAECIQRVTEQGDELEQREGPHDLYDCFSRIIIAELSDELEHLPEINDRQERRRALREISRDLTRLQYGYNHSKRTELAWCKWNDQFENPDPVDEKSTLTDEPVKPSQAESGQKETQSIAPAEPLIQTVQRFIRQRNCSHSCICKNCHPDDGDYPYAEAVKDYAGLREFGSAYGRRENVYLWFTLAECKCYCDCEKTSSWKRQEFGRGLDSQTLNSQLSTPDPQLLGKPPMDSKLSAPRSTSILRA